MDNPQVTWTHPFLHEFLNLIPKNIATLIDVGCGRGIVGALMRIYRSPKWLVGVDVFKPYLKFCKQYHLYDEQIRLDLRVGSLPFADKQFNVATCLETIEHLAKADGKKLLNELERIGKIIIISTPNRYFIRYISAPERYFHQRHFDSNPWQEHLSKWSVSDFTNRGYEVRGVSPYLPFFIPRKFAWIFPSLFYTILAYKAIGQAGKTCP